MTTTNLEKKTEIVPVDKEHIIFSEQAFSEFLAAISEEPESPPPKLLNAVAAYKQHNPKGSLRLRNHPLVYHLTANVIFTLQQMRA